MWFTSRSSAILSKLKLKVGIFSFIQINRNEWVVCCIVLFSPLFEISTWKFYSKRSTHRNVREQWSVLNESAEGRSSYSTSVFYASLVKRYRRRKKKQYWKWVEYIGFEWLLRRYCVAIATVDSIGMVSFLGRVKS